MSKWNYLSGVLLTGLLLLGAASKVEGITLPPGFSDTAVTDVASPTALAFTPDGRLLIAEKPGRLWVYQNGVLSPTPALDLTGRICTERERGLLGVAVDPGFAAIGHVYLYYTAGSAGSCVNRVSRFVLSEGNVLGDEFVLVDNMPSPSPFHNAGDLHFGKDGFLYISVGDGGCDYADPNGCGRLNDAARDQHVLVGKVLRITSTGEIPLDNPFVGPDSARCNVSGQTAPGNKCQEIFVFGLRNAFRMAFDPNAAGTRFYINDVGEDHWEEIDVGQAGADYGWNVREGSCSTGSETDCGERPAGMTNPIFAYSHTATDPIFAGCSSITGGAFVPAGVWPAEFEGAYLFSDFVCGRIFSLSPSHAATSFATNLGSAATLLFGPHEGTQALYYTTFHGGQVRRIAFVGSVNRAPAAVGNATPTNGPVPLPVAFSANESSDPDGDPLAFEWDFGDGTPPIGASETGHVYGTTGIFVARLRVDDGRGGSDTTSVRIDPGHFLPEAHITSPAPGTRFRVGQAITLSGHAVDETGLRLPDPALRWTVRLHHDTHTHPFLDPTTGNGIVIVTPAPEDLPATTTSFLEVRLTATDARGLSQTITRELRPRLVRLRFATRPRALQLRIQGTMLRAPQNIVSWLAYRIHVDAPKQIRKGKVWRFLEWSDGRKRRHIIRTPSKRRTYRAFFD
jgi:glucose/arabinose dehydrogenase